MTEAFQQPDDCLDEDGIVELLQGVLAPAERERVASHLGSCSGCRRLVADMTLALSGPAQSGLDELVPLRAGATLGRYVVIGPVGSGTMGLVYSAFDRELGRKVALKLLRPGAFERSPDDLLSKRLRREAQALALLSHPNVVAVHEVDTFEGRIFLAMEFVEGSTLGKWLRDEKHSWREVVAIFRQAGAGLSAAHAAGLVHRDFKPDNVLVGADGRVRVTDFGLARTQQAPAPDAVAPAHASGGTLDGSLTATGALIGTPAYMAPEQLAPGGFADPLSDQFAYCVAFFEALYGQRPFQASDVASLHEVVREGRVRGARRGHRVPRWLERLVLRGLSADRTRRWPSMPALLAQLERGPLLTPLRAAALVLVVGAAAAFAWTARPVCTGAEAAWGALWNPEQQAAVRAAALRTGRPAAGLVFANLDAALSRFRDGWEAMHREACLATRVRREQSEALLDLRIGCLANQRRHAEALVHAFANADAALIDAAPAALDTLPSLEPCSNAMALLASTPLPADPEKRSRIAALEGTLAEISVRVTAPGKARDVIDQLAPALAEARQLGALSLVARFLVQRSRLEEQSGAQRANESLHEAAAAAVEGKDDGALADAWNRAISLAPTSEEGHRLARYSAAAIARLGGDDEREGARLAYLAGLLVWRDKRFEEARPFAQRSRELLVKARGPDYWRVAYADEMLGAIEFNLGRGEEALAAYQRTEAIRIKAFGADSGAVAISIGNQASTLCWLGRYDESAALQRRALAQIERAVPDRNNFYGHHQLAMALRGMGKFAEALEEDLLAERTLARFSPPDDHAHCDALEGEGADQLGLGHPRLAIAPLERALLLCEHDVDLFEPAGIKLRLARALWDSGEDEDRARQLGRDAAAAFQSAAERHGSWFSKLGEESARWVAEHR